MAHTGMFGDNPCRSFHVFLFYHHRSQGSLIANPADIKDRADFVDNPLVLQSLEPLEHCLTANADFGSQGSEGFTV